MRFTQEASQDIEILDSQQLITICFSLSPSLQKETMQPICSYLQYQPPTEVSLKPEYRSYLYGKLNQNRQDIEQLYQEHGNKAGIDTFWRTYHPTKPVVWRWRPLKPGEPVTFDLINVQDLEGSLLPNPQQAPAGPSRGPALDRSATINSFAQLTLLIKQHEESVQQRFSDIDAQQNLFGSQMDQVVSKLEELDNQRPELEDQLYSMEFVVKSTFNNTTAIAQQERVMEEQEANVSELKREIEELRVELAKMQAAIQMQQNERAQEKERLEQMETRQANSEKRQDQQHENLDRWKKTHNLIVWNLPEMPDFSPMRNVMTVMRDLGFATLLPREITVRRIPARNGTSMHTITFVNVDTMEDVLKAFRRTQRNHRLNNRPMLPYSMDRDKTVFQQRLDRLTQYKAVYLNSRSQNGQTYIKWDEGKIAVYNDKTDKVPSLVMSPTEVAALDVDPDYAATHPLPRHPDISRHSPSTTDANQVPLGNRPRRQPHTPEPSHPATVPNLPVETDNITPLDPQVIPETQPSSSRLPPHLTTPTRAPNPPRLSPLPSPPKRKRMEPVPRLSPKKPRTVQKEIPETPEPKTLKEHWALIKGKIEAFQQNRAQQATAQEETDDPDATESETEEAGRMEVDPPEDSGEAPTNL